MYAMGSVVLVPGSNNNVLNNTIINAAQAKEDWTKRYSADNSNYVLLSVGKRDLNISIKLVMPVPKVTAS